MLWWDREFGACGCGAPEDVAELLRDVLAAVDLDEGKFARLDELIPQSGAQYWILYYVAHLGLTEHGGSVPGWLTPRGKEVLAALRLHGVDNLDAWDPATDAWQPENEAWLAEWKAR
jgi:hypothetical protein